MEEGLDYQEEDTHDLSIEPTESYQNYNFLKVNDDNQLNKRERNRILARETRIRKKNNFESLKKQVCSLVKENELLKEVVKNKMEKSLAERVLSQCCKDLPDVVTTVATQATSMLAQEDFGLISAIRSAQRAFCITDPYLPDNPIVFASQGFLDLTKYSIDQVLNRNCRFLQGPLTDQIQVAVLADGIQRGVDTSVPLLNYKADGTLFWNQVYVAALRDSNNVIVNYVGVQCEIQPDIAAAAGLRGIDEMMENDNTRSKKKQKKK